MVKRFLFDVEVLVRDGENSFSLRFKDLKVECLDEFTAYVDCHNYIHHFLNGSTVSPFFFIIKNMECREIMSVLV